MANKLSGTGVCAASIGSVTHAMKAQKLLTDQAIQCSVSKVTDKSGCVYGIKFPCVHKNNVQSILSNGGIRVKEYL